MDTSILVTVRYTVKKGQREEFFQKVVAQGIDVASRNEAGNLKYDYYYPVDSEDDLCLMEIWTSVEAQKVHAATAHYQALSELKNQYVENTQLQIYHLKDEK